MDNKFRNQLLAESKKREEELKDLNPFNRVLVETPDRNTFDLSFDNKLTLDMGNLYPVLVQETLPVS